MIHFVAGKPGNGKSLFAAWLIILELVFGRRPIVTNLALRLHPWVDGKGKARKGLIRFLEDEYGESFDAARRVLLLDDTQVKRFYAYRPLIPPLEGEERQIHVIPQADDGRFRFTPDLPGCFQVVDEIHEHFGARDWQTTGREALSWGSQHRRAGDEMYAVTQVVNNVEKQFRGISQECIIMVNHGFRTVGMFRQPNIITLRVYSTTPPAPMEVPMRFERLKFNRQKVYEVYDTASGVGVTGRKADIGTKAKGWPWWTVILLVLGGMVGLWLLIKVYFVGVKHVAKMSMPGMKRAAAEVATPMLPTNSAAKKAKSYDVVTIPQAGSVGELSGAVRVDPRIKPAVKKTKDEEEWELVAGLAQGSAGWSVTLANGVQFRAKSVIESGPELNIDGHIYRRAPMNGVAKPKGK